jgi:hypothetical protein
LPPGFRIVSKYNFNLLAEGKNYLYLVCTKKDGTNFIIRTSDLVNWEQVGFTNDKLISLSFWPTKNWLIVGSQGSQAKVWKIDLNRIF